MTSLPNNFVFGSASSALSVRDAIASYRRAQYLAAESTVVRVPESDDEGDDDDEFPSLYHRHDVSSSTERDDTAVEDDFIDQLEWDEEENIDTPEPPPIMPPTLRYNLERRLQSPKLSVKPTSHDGQVAHEDTPLLRKAISLYPTPNIRRASAPSKLKSPAISVLELPERPSLFTRPTLPRRPSTSSTQSGKYLQEGQSTFGQTLFNCIAVLLGIGMLSEPLAFAYSGWITGTALIVSYGFISCYTAKILARIILADPHIRSYADIGRKAFGPKSTPFISGMFCLELFSVSVVLVTLFADSLHAILPQYSSTTYKIWGSVLLIPTVFLPLSLLAYTSILGIVSSVLIIFVVLFDGFSKLDSPGSIWSPAQTTLGVGNWKSMGLAFGLFMAGFSGHAVIPSLATDMADPTQFDTMINWAFVVTTFLYALIGWAGYLMFGNLVSEEISMDLLTTQGYNPLLNKIALWMLVISPLSKFALTTYPLNSTIAMLLGSSTPHTTAEESPTTKSLPTWLKKLFSAVGFQRILVTILSILVSILVPEFSSMMAFLGSFSAFILCVIGPISAKVTLAGRCGVFDAVVLTLGIIKAIWGTVAAFSAD